MGTLSLVLPLLCLLFTQVILSSSLQQSQVSSSNVPLSLTAVDPLHGHHGSPPSPLDEESGSDSTSGPRAPPTPDIFIANITAVVVRWDYLTTNPPTQFMVQCYSNDFDNDIYNNVSDLLNSTQFLYNHMKELSYYLFKVIAYREGVASSPSPASQVFQNAATAPTGPPTDVEIVSVTAISIKLNWDTPRPTLDRAYAYHIFKGDNPGNLQEVDSINNEDQYTFRHLVPNTKYFFAIQADIGGVKSILSTVVNQTTMPLELTPLTINVSANVTTAIVSWTPPTYNSLQFYTVCYIPEALHTNDLSLYTCQNFSELESSGTFTGLEEGVVYVFIARYFAYGYPSNLSRPVTVQTLSSVVCTACVGVSSSEIELHWKTQSYHAPAHFSINSTTCPNSTITTSNSSISLIVSNITPWTRCNYSVAALTAYGYYEKPTSCPTMRCITHQERPSGYPHNFSGRALSAQSIEFQWDPLPLKEQNGPITFYVIVCLNCKSTTIFSVTDSPTVVNDFSPYTSYNFVISAENEIGFGPSSDFISVLTLEAKPSGPPRNVAMTTATNTSLSITWSPPLAEERNGIIIHYEVFYRVNGSGAARSIITDSMEATLRGLESSTAYCVEVRASTSKGAGPFSPEVVFTTLSYTVPLPVITDFSITSRDQSLISTCFSTLLFWSFNATPPAFLKNAEITYYPTNENYSNTSSKEFQLVVGPTQFTIALNSLSADTNYTFVLSASFVLENGSSIELSESTELLTPNCSGVTTVVLVVCVVSGSIVFIVLAISVFICCLCCRMRSKLLSRSTQARNEHGMLQLPSNPNAYLSDFSMATRRDERGDGQSSDGEMSDEVASTVSVIEFETESSNSSLNENNPLIDHMLSASRPARGQSDDDSWGFRLVPFPGTNYMRFMPIGGELSSSSSLVSIVSAPD